MHEKKILSLTTLLLFTVIISSQAQVGSTVLFQGTALEQKSNKPLEIRYELASPDGQKIRGKSASDGTFQQVLKPGTTYSAFLYGKNYFLMDSIVLRPGTKYYEEKKNFSLKVLTPNSVIDAFNAFKKNSAEFDEDAKNRLKSILSAFKQEELPSLVISIADESGAKKKGKKKNSAPTLLDQRISAMQNFVAELSRHLTDKVTVAPAKGKAKTNIQISVGKISA